MKSILLAAFLTGAIAFTSSAADINARRENQQQRIAAGIRAGQLSPREAGNLEYRESALNREIRRDRAFDNGRLTRGERLQINRQQNVLSHHIFVDRHN